LGNSFIVAQHLDMSPIFRWASCLSPTYALQPIHIELNLQIEMQSNELVEVTINCTKCNQIYKYQDIRCNLSKIRLGANISCPCGNSFDVEKINKLAEIRAILIFFDECLHIADRKREAIGRQLIKHFCSILSSKIDNPIPIIIPSTKSPIFNFEEFFHENKKMAYKNQNKDLAILQYCSAGLQINEGEPTIHVLDEVRNHPLSKQRISSIPNEYWAVVFATKDKSGTDPGMKKALNWVSQSNSRSNFVCIEVPEEYGNNKHKGKYIAEILAIDISNRFIRAEEGKWFIDIS
jgi:transcription elongation factor Elf1